MLTVVPFVYYRCDYTHSKRLREVDPGKVYRSGQLTVDGFIEAVRRYHIQTIINLQDEYPDPDILTLDNRFRICSTRVWEYPRHVLEDLCPVTDMISESAKPASR